MADEEKPKERTVREIADAIFAHTEALNALFKEGHKIDMRYAVHNVAEAPYHAPELKVEVVLHLHAQKTH